MGAPRLLSLFTFHVVILFAKASLDPSSFPSIREPVLLSDEDPGFDLLLLVRTWPPTFCEQLREQREECTAPPLQEFTLHGLWPEYSSGGWPQYCSTTIVKNKDGEEEEEAGVVSELETTRAISSNDEDDKDGKVRCEWPSFHGSTQNFWDHEWDKHGTCAAPLLGNRTSFFKTVVTLHDQFNLNSLFRSRGLWPVGNSQGVFESAEASQAIKNKFGVMPRLACHKGSLSEVWMCLDLELNPIECPAKVKPGQMCGTQFRMPPGTQASRDCQQFFPGEGRNWGQYLHWPVILGVCVLLASILSAILVELRRKTEQRSGSSSGGCSGDAAAYEPLGEA